MTYEDLTAQPQRVVNDTLSPFLGVPATEVTTALMKQNRRPLADIVVNYDEVQHLLTGETSRHDYA